MLSSPQHACEQSDAEQAYIQAPLRGTPYLGRTSDQWLVAWAGMRRPVCRLLRSMYGHPNYGTDWEDHRDAQVLNAGFKPVLKDGHMAVVLLCRGLEPYIVVYVDDSKLAGLARNLTKV